MGDSRYKSKGLPIEFLEKPLTCPNPPLTLRDNMIADELRKKCMLEDKKACKEFNKACLGSDVYD